MTSILALLQQSWGTNAAFLCIGVLYFAALIRSRTNKGEGAH
jgi:hypothetical protein